MDSLTHTVLGACLGEMIAGRQLGKKAMLAGIIVNNLPDADVAMQLFSSPAEGLLLHRGITHSVLMCAILSGVFAWLFYFLFKKQGLTRQQSLLLAASGLFLHIFLDSLTSYGTGWFEPFSHARISFNVLFILDPFLLLPLLVSAIALLALKTKSPKRIAWAKGALSVALVYLLITVAIKIYIDRTVRKDLAARNIPHSDYMTSPAPLNNLLWYVVAKNNDRNYVGYYSVFDKVPRVDYETVPRHDSLLTRYRNSPEVQRLILFSKGYYCVNYEDSNLVFSDIRFGQAGGWYMNNTPFVFRFNIVGRNSAAHLQQSRFKAFEGGAIAGLVKRIGGNKSK